MSLWNSGDYRIGPGATIPESPHMESWINANDCCMRFNWGGLKEVTIGALRKCKGRLLSNVELIEGSLQDANKQDFRDAE